MTSAIKTVKFATRAKRSATRRTYRAYKVVAKWLAIRRHQGDAVFLFGCPIHPNLGDQAQRLCIGDWVQKNYPGHRLIELDHTSSGSRILSLAQKMIRKQDVILFHSGYLMTDHHSELPVLLEVIRRFPNHRIVIFPQTILIKDAKLRTHVAETFDQHPDLVLLCRDEVSHATASEIFKRARLLLYPDIVTTLIGSRQFDRRRRGVLFCMRRDIEAHYSVEDVEALRERLQRETTTAWTDTTVSVERWKMERERRKIIDDFIEAISNYQVVITDRYHGTIFSIVAGAHVIVLASADHKLESGVKWFPESFATHVSFAADLEEAHNLATKALVSTGDWKPETHFRENYFENLTQEIGTM